MQCRQTGNTSEQIAQQYGVSTSLTNYRLRVTGIEQQFSRRKRFRTVSRAESTRRPSADAGVQFEVSMDCLVRDNAESLRCRAHMSGCAPFGIQDIIARRQSHAIIPILVGGHPHDFLLPLPAQNHQRILGIVHGCALRSACLCDLERLGRNDFQVSLKETWRYGITRSNAAEGNQKEAADDQVFKEQMLPHRQSPPDSCSDQTLRPCVAANNLRPEVEMVRPFTSTIGRPVPAATHVVEPPGSRMTPKSLDA